MDTSDPPIAAFTNAQLALKPYIKSRQEVSNIRRILAAHLNTSLGHEPGLPRFIPPLSLSSTSSKIGASSTPLLGVRKEYLRILQRYGKACEEFENVSSGNSVSNIDSATHQPGSKTTSHPSVTDELESGGNLEGYLDLVKQRQQHERLCILEDYVKKLQQKSATAISSLEQAIERDAPLPRVPTDLISSSNDNLKESRQTSLKTLIRDLERAVLRARVQLRDEQQRLEHVKRARASQCQESLDPSLGGEVLQALGRTRNELINWVETELGKAGEDVPPDTAGQHLRSASDPNKSVQQQLDSVKARYSQYIHARKALLDILAEPINSSIVTGATDSRVNELDEPEKDANSSSIYIIAPYLLGLITASNEQKSLIQHKSHVTVTLAKQHKESIQAFDRLADESHLLSAYTLSNSQASGRGFNQSVDVEMVNKEIANASHRARAWTCAAELSSSATKEFVLSNTIEGEAAINVARQHLKDVERLLGYNANIVPPEKTGSGQEQDDTWIPGAASGTGDGKKPNQTAQIPHSIWATLDGHLGVLKRELED